MHLTLLVLLTIADRNGHMEVYESQCGMQREDREKWQDRVGRKAMAVAPVYVHVLVKNGCYYYYNLFFRYFCRIALRS